MLRLTIQSRTPEKTVVVVDGRIGGEDVAFLAGKMAEWLQQTRLLELALDGVQSIDREGLELLRGQMGKNLVFSGGSSFVQMMLQRRE